MRLDSKEFCGEGCSKLVDERGNYSSHVFARETIRTVNEHDSSKGRLFLYLAFQAVHIPLQVPKKYYKIYENTGWDTTRKYYAGMHTAADEAIGQVKLAMEKRGLWEDTLVVFTTDNGRAVTGKVRRGTDRGAHGQVVRKMTRTLQLSIYNLSHKYISCINDFKASNYPHRGGKKDVWEGGVAGDGFILGPAI
jgi:arylsulfatase A-like enzyme